MKKRISLLAMSLVLVLTVFTVSASAAVYEPEFTDEAELLYDLGLFRGTGVNEDGTPIFALEKPATRMQGLIMLIRLLGEEEEALAYEGPCPFTDVSGNSAKYAAYAYSKGYTSGTSATTFGNGPLKSNAFLTFVLRALGYDDQAGDFAYSSAILLAEEIELITRGEYVNGSATLYRDACAQIAYNALLTKPKGEAEKLVWHLLEEGAVTESALAASEILVEEPVYSETLDYEGWHVFHDQYMDKRVRTAAKEQAKFYGLDENMGWVSDPDTKEEFINNMLGCFMVGDYSLDNLTVRDRAFAEEMFLYFKNSRMELCSSFAELMGAFVNPEVEWKIYLLQDEENSYSCTQYHLCVPDAPLSNEELYQQQQEALAEVQRIYDTMHVSEEIVSGDQISSDMDPIRIARIYYNFMQTGGYAVGDNYQDISRQETMKNDTAYACLSNKRANCLGRAAAYTMLLNLEGIDVQTVHCRFVFSPDNERHVLNRFVVGDQEYICDWYNRLPIMPLEMSYNWLRYSNLSLEIARTRAA
ncbi:MAG: S-layer homology domain-containing protein [Oscillospiraceae bacterium]|nr:S-layer homology domain-containing protein [Oscillospiraceae bacterium]